MSPSPQLKKKLAVTAHFFSESAREKIEGAGGSVTALKEVKPKRRRRKAATPAEPAPAAEEASEEEAEGEGDVEPEQPAEGPAESQ